MQDAIQVYGADWCPDTRRTRRQLESLGVRYDFIDIERNEEAGEQVKQWNGGRRVMPTVVLPTGNVATGQGRDRLAAPSEDELATELRERGLQR